MNPRTTVTFAALLLAPLAALQAADTPTSQKALVTVHAEKPGAKIPSDFLGFSCEKKILSRECFQPKNAALVALFRNLGDGVLRVGGNEVDSTSWSRTEMAPLGSMKENRYSEKATTIGPLSLDNLYAFAKQSGWRVIHGLNLGANDPAMAADEAAYALQVGGPLVLAFEIGNEPNLYPKSTKHAGKRPANYGYAQYRQEFEAYASAVRSKLPNAPLAGPATTRICKWFPDFVTDFKNRMALTTSHIYPLSAKEENPQSPRFASVENLLSIKVEQEWVPQLESSKAAGIPFRLGECNTASGGGKTGVSDAFASALWGVDFLFDVAEHGGAGINLHGGFTPGNYSPICYLKKEDRYEASPLYYGMLLFHQAARGHVVPVECQTSARFTAHAVMGDDHKLRVALINKDLTTAVTASIATGSLRTKAGAIRLSAPSVTSTAGVALANSTVAKDGTWTPQPAAIVPCVNGKCEVSLPAVSAALLTIE